MYVIDTFGNHYKTKLGVNGHEPVEHLVVRKNCDFGVQHLNKKNNNIIDKILELVKDT